MHGNLLNRNKLKLFNTANSDLNSRIIILENNVYKITYYEIITGATGTLTVPTGATINSGEFSGALISGSVATGIYMKTKKPLASAFLGSLVGITAGILKEEVWDRSMKKGVPTDEDKIASTTGSLYIILPFAIITDKCKREPIDTTKYNFKKESIN